MLNEKIQELENIINGQKGINNNGNINKIIELYEELRIKDKQIIDLSDIKSRYPFELLKGEKLMSVIFTPLEENVFSTIICKNTELFADLEKKFYEIYPEYHEGNNIFINNGKQIIRHKTLEENNIRKSDIITFINPQKTK